MASGYPSQSSAFRKRCTAMPSIIIPAPKHGGSGRIDFPAADANRFQASLNVADTITARWQVVGADAAAVEFGDEAGDVQAEAEMECAVDVDRAGGQAQLERVAGGRRRDSPRRSPPPRRRDRRHKGAARILIV